MRFIEEQIIRLARAGKLGVPVKALCRKHAFPYASYYACQRKFTGMDVSDAKQLKALEAQRVHLKKLLTELMLDKEVKREPYKMMVTARPCRGSVQWNKTQGLSDWRGLQVAGMSASALH